MSARFQRLLFILLSLFFLAFSIILILSNSKNNLIFFYTPSELMDSDSKIGDTIRIGGYVKKNSVQILMDNSYIFTITDNLNNLDIIYKGLLPDLFREEQGIVIQGELKKNYTIKASTVFAKHDENYMPSTIKQQLEKNEYWKKKYK